MLKLSALITLVFTATATAALAECPADQQTILTCNISDSEKTLIGCHNGQTATYSFGLPGENPELTITAPVTQINYTPWNGIGRSIHEQVIFENAGIGYLLWAAFEKNPQAEQPLSGGIIVQKNGQDLASLMCDPASMQVGIDALFAVMQSHGQCWDYGEFRWITCK